MSDIIDTVGVAGDRIRSPVLRGFLAECLAEEARVLPDALWVPCGSTAAEGVEWIVRQGVLDQDRVCLGMPHLSPANAERVQYFLGTGRDRSALSAKTDPERIERSRAGMVTKVALLGTLSPADIEPATSISTAPLPPESKAPAKATKPRKTEPKLPSRLGLAVQAAIDGDSRYVAHQPERLYQCTYRTRVGGTVFAFERVTANAINMWLPAVPAVIEAAAKAGIVVPDVSRPYPNPSRPDRYGRLSSLEYVPELKDADLLAIKVSSDRQALAILSGLT